MRPQGADVPASGGTFRKWDGRDQPADATVRLGGAPQTGKAAAMPRREGLQRPESAGERLQDAADTIADASDNELGARIPLPDPLLQ
jgi:hypothetical protein